MIEHEGGNLVEPLREFLAALDGSYGKVMTADAIIKELQQR